MRTPLSILSRGRLAGGIKKPLAILSIGWLVTVAAPPMPPSGGGYGGGYQAYNEVSDDSERRKILLRQNQEQWMQIIKIFLECQ